MVDTELIEGDESVCARCGELIRVRRVPTGRMFSGPFWHPMWVHEYNLDPKCWSPTAEPIRNVSDLIRVIREVGYAD